MGKVKAKQARMALAAAHGELRRLGALLRDSLRIEHDLNRRIRDEGVTPSLAGLRRHFTRLRQRILDAYLGAFASYRTNVMTLVKGEKRIARAKRRG